jgi:hypothetical protein
VFYGRLNGLIDGEGKLVIPILAKWLNSYAESSLY